MDWEILSYATINGWSEDSFVARAKPMLKEIWRLYKEIINDAPVSWLEFCNLLLRHFKLSSTQATQKLHLKRLARKERRYMNLLMPRNSYSGKLVCQSPCRSYILLRSYGLSSPWKSWTVNAPHCSKPYFSRVIWSWWAIHEEHACSLSKHYSCVLAVLNTLTTQHTITRHMPWTMVLSRWRLGVFSKQPNGSKNANNGPERFNGHCNVCHKYGNAREIADPVAINMLQLILERELLPQSIISDKPTLFQILIQLHQSNQTA